MAVRSRPMLKDDATFERLLVLANTFTVLLKNQ